MYLIGLESGKLRQPIDQTFINGNWCRQSNEPSTKLKHAAIAQRRKTRLVLTEKVLWCASRSKSISPFLYSDDQCKKMAVSTGNFYPFWLLSLKFQNSFRTVPQDSSATSLDLEVQSEQQISKFCLQRHSVAVDLSGQNFLPFRSARENHGRFAHETRWPDSRTDRHKRNSRSWKENRW